MYFVRLITRSRPRLIAALLGVILLFMTAGVAAAREVPRSAPPPAADRAAVPTLWAVDNVGGTWWAAGDGGVVLKWTKKATKPYLKRYSAGRKYSLSSVDCVTAKLGYAVGVTMDAKKGFILKTTNGGKKWVRQKWTPLGLTDVRFVSRAKGFAVGPLGTMYRTTNGGKTWKKQRTGLTFTHLYDISFPTKRTGYVGGWALDLKTTNGGTMWKKQSFAGQSSGLGTDAYMWATEFVSAARGWGGGRYFAVSSQEDLGFILRTTNGGKTWTPSDFAEEPITAIDFLNRNRGFACGFGDGVDAGLYESDDGGAGWVLCDIDQEFPAKLQDLKMSLRSGFAVGDGMGILRYTEGVWVVDRAPE